jgi:hypothetical protein
MSHRQFRHCCTLPLSPTDHYDFIVHTPEHDREGSYIPTSNRPGLDVELMEARIIPLGCV